MASVNKVILLGTLGRDPEVRFSANQLPDGDIRAQSEGLAMLNWLYLFRSRGGLSRSEVCGEM